MNTFQRCLLTATAACGLAMASAPALAQTVDELTVVGRFDVNGEWKELSAPVSYADLDLTTDGDQAVFKDRIKVAAHDLCVKLGENNTAPQVGATCEQDAMTKAWDQAKMAIASATPRGGPAPMAMTDPAPMPAPAPAPAATSYGQSASFTTTTVTNGPVPDTKENRAKYGSPMSNAGKRTAPAGN